MDWLLIIVFILLLMLLVFLARKIYITSRSIKQELIVKQEVTKPNTSSNHYEGVYFTRYMPERKNSLQVIDNESVSKKISRKIRQKTGWVIDLNTVKLGISSLLVFIFMVGIVASLFTSHDHTPQFVNNHTELLATKQLSPVPLLTTELSKLKAYGFVLVSNQASSTEVMLNQLKQQAQQEWTDFANAYQLKTATCTWDQLVQCQQHYQDWIFVILPDFWQLAGLDKLLTSGASVLLYDVPFQVASAYTTGEFSLYGLTFEQLLANATKKQTKTQKRLPTKSQAQQEQLVLIGERELHFGFNTGTIINITRRSTFYKATSIRPQALALPAKNQVGDVLMTRLYATSIGRGRLVWMDFIPKHENDTETLHQHHVDSVMASLFSYLKKSRVFPLTLDVGKK